MQNLVVIAKNEEACKLLDCLVAYNKLAAAKPSVGSNEAGDFDSGLVVVPEAEKGTIRV